MADTANWINFFHRGDAIMEQLTSGDRLVMHPMVLGEISVGMLKHRETKLRELSMLPMLEEAKHDDVLHFISLHKLFQKGIGFIDAHLLLSAKISSDTLLLTDDKRLRALAEGFGVAYRPPRIF